MFGEGLGSVRDKKQKKYVHGRGGTHPQKTANPKQKNMSSGKEYKRANNVVNRRRINRGLGRGTRTKTQLRQGQFGRDLFASFRKAAWWMIFLIQFVCLVEAILGRVVIRVVRREVFAASAVRTGGGAVVSPLRDKRGQEACSRGRIMRWGVLQGVWIGISWGSGRRSTLDTLIRGTPRKCGEDRDDRCIQVTGQANRSAGENSPVRNLVESEP